MAKVLVKTNYNWADEADFPSFCIMEDTKLESYRKAAKEYFDQEDYYEIEVGVGTNEGIIFNSYDDVFETWQFEVKTLNEQEYEIIKKFFGVSFGECNLNHVMEYVIEALDEVQEPEDKDNNKIEADDL